MKHTLGSYLIDTNAFMDHIRDRYSIEKHAFDPILCNNIDISSYVTLLAHQSKEFQYLFYTKFNKLLESSGIYDKYIASHGDITDKLHLICWIYYIQETFL